MNKQKWLAGLTAVLCSAGALSCFPAISGTVSAAELVSNDFEVNYGGWHGSDDAVDSRRRYRSQHVPWYVCYRTNQHV